MPGVPLDVMDKLKAIFKRKKEPGPSATAGTKTESPNQTGGPTQMPTKTNTADKPSSSEPVAPATGAAPINTEPAVDKPAEPTPATAPTVSDPVAPAATPTSAVKDEAAAVAAK